MLNEHDAALAQLQTLPEFDTNKPLIICDVDEVLLEFIRPFMLFLEAHGYILKTDTYRLTGNIFPKESDIASSGETVSWLLNRFFAQQTAWQVPVSGAVDIVKDCARTSNVVILTAMPARFRYIRLQFLQRLGFNYPIIAANKDKGDLIATLSKHHKTAFFIDDLPANHHSIAHAAPEVTRLHFMAYRNFTAGIPKTPQGTISVDDWCELGRIITR